MEKYFHIFDTHSHYDDARFEGRGDELIASLFNDGISGIIHAATDFESARFGLKMSEKYPRYYTSVGIHPEYADCFSEDDILSLEKLARASEKVVAIGEIGLDYHYEGYDRERQTQQPFRTSVQDTDRACEPSRSAGDSALPRRRRRLYGYPARAETSGSYALLLGVG